MSDQKKNPDHSVLLNLGKFAPGAGPTMHPNNEPSPTVVIKHAAAEVAKQSGSPIVPKDGGALPAPEMLGAVSYCYAKGVYTSEDIERKMRRDPKLRAAVGGDVPDANAIRRFRRLNRDAIRSTLEKAFLFFRKKRPAPEPLPGQPANPQPSEINAGESTINMARHDAQNKIDEAAFIDNMSKD
jgi:hypothetical protein